MRAIIIGVVAFLFHSVNAQEYRKFKVGGYVGYLNRYQPIAASYELAYRLNDRMSIGYRGEYAANISISIASKGLYYQFYFSGYKKIRPYFSLGLAQYSPNTDMAGGCGAPHVSSNVSIEKKIGAFARVGFDLGHLSLMVDANLAPNSKSTVITNLPPTDANYQAPYTQYLSNSYLTFKVGFFIGGGKRKLKNAMP